MPIIYLLKLLTKRLVVIWLNKCPAACAIPTMKNLNMNVFVAIGVATVSGGLYDVAIFIKLVMAQSIMMTNMIT